MYQTKITEREAGQRFDKYLHKFLPAAGSGFIHKMLRKKNITLNAGKADGSERISAGDSVEIFFAKETLDQFRGLSGGSGEAAAYRRITGVGILYENDHILLADKPAGVLSQRAARTDDSLNEWLIGYLLASGSLRREELATYKPSVCNRLDRNTSGIVLCAKTVKGAQTLGELLKNRTLHKYYQTYVKGVVSGEERIEGYLRKDERQNKAFVTAARSDRDAYIQTAYRPVRVERDKTLLEVELITGKPHQIRAHLAGVGHPVLGDYKYGDREWNEKYRQSHHVRSQLLHAYKVVFPELGPPFEDISGRTFCADMPKIFMEVSSCQL